MENAEIIYDLCPGKFIWILKSLIISGKQYFWTTIQKGVPFNSKHILLENACPKLILAGTTISRKKNGGPDLICENNFKGKTISEMKTMIPSKCTWQKINNWLTTISRNKKRRAWFDLKKKKRRARPTFMACHEKWARNGLHTTTNHFHGLPWQNIFHGPPWEGHGFSG